MQEKKNERIKAQNILDYFKSNKKLPLIIAGGLLGILLLFFAGSGGTGEKEVAAESLFSEQTTALSSYEAKLEKEIELLCESVSGVSDAAVMIGFSGGFRVEYLTDGGGDPVTVGSGSNEDGVFATLLPPSVSGVGIVCRGGNRPEVQAILTELISTALGIPDHRVFVTGK